MFVVDCCGKGRFRPQSPHDSADWVVSRAAVVGYGKVAVWDWGLSNVALPWLGRGRGGGKENKRECWRSLAVGDKLLFAIDLAIARKIAGAIFSVGGRAS